MKYIIYMDVFFVVNAVMDTVLLKLASFYIKPQTTFVKCVAGGMVGGVTSCIIMLLPYKNMLIHTLYSYIFIALLMVFVTFGKGNVKQIAGRTASLYFVTIVLGGAMNLLYDYTYFGYIVQGILSAIYANPINIIRLVIFTCISYIILQSAMKFLQGKKIEKNRVRVELIFKGNSISLKGLIDSGNSLVDPYYGKPVHIVEYEALQMILEGVDIHREKYRLVPFHSLGQKNGLVEVIELDKIMILNDDCDMLHNCGGEKKTLYEEEKPAIGIYHGTLSGDKKFEIILHSTVESLI